MSEGVPASMEERSQIPSSWLWPTSPAWSANWSRGSHSPLALNSLRTPESPSTSLHKTPRYFNYSNLPKKYINFTGEKVIPRYDRKVPGAFSFWAWRSYLSLILPASRMLVRERWASTLSKFEGLGWHVDELAAPLNFFFRPRLCCYRTKSFRTSYTIS